MGLAKHGFGQGDIQSGKHNPDKMVVFQRRKSARPVFKPGGKSSRFFPENIIRTAKVYIVLQNLAEADTFIKNTPHTSKKHSIWAKRWFGAAIWPSRGVNIIIFD
jgi:hypothetical protein